MIGEEELNEFRVKGQLVRVKRDMDSVNDVIGTIVAWDEQTVLVRKRNRRVVKLDRSYNYVAEKNN